MTTSDRPVLLLDFDGVINVFASFAKVPDTDTWTAPKMLTNLWPEHTWRRTSWLASGQRWPIQYSTDVIRQINAIHADGQVEIRWHSTWQDQIFGLDTHLGLPRLPIHDAPEVDANWGQLQATLMARGKPGWWKYPAAERVLLVEQRPLIWVDDDLTGNLSRLYRDKMGRMGRFLPLSPDVQTGLTPRYFKLLGQFLAALEEEHDQV